MDLPDTVRMGEYKDRSFVLQQENRPLWPNEPKSVASMVPVPCADQQEREPSEARVLYGDVVAQSETKRKESGWGDRWNEAGEDKSWWSSGWTWWDVWQESKDAPCDGESWWQRRGSWSTGHY